MVVVPKREEAPPGPPTRPEDSIAILAPFGQDALLMADLFREDAESVCCFDIQHFCQSLTVCAIGVLTTEALNPTNIQQLGRVLREQPAWSDIPLILLSNKIDTASYALLAEMFQNVTIIQRPLDSHSLLTVVRTALRARNRQYQVRNLLTASIQQQARIEALNEQLKRAMTETHHRVKNSLQLICAFVELQAIEYKDAVPIHELQRINTQVRTLAAVHDILTQETKKHFAADFVSAKLLLEQVLSMLGSMTGAKRLRYTVDDARLSSRQGTSLALVASELILNSLKHSGNEVEVRLEVKTHHIVLTVSDDGPGFPEGFNVEQASNTGLALVENLARWDLCGETLYTNRADQRGAQIQVIFASP